MIITRFYRNVRVNLEMCIFAERLYVLLLAVVCALDYRLCLGSDAVVAAAAGWFDSAYSRTTAPPTTWSAVTLAAAAAAYEDNTSSGPFHP